VEGRREELEGGATECTLVVYRDPVCPVRGIQSEACVEFSVTGKYLSI
jgi:hypothetical protein